MDIETLFHRFIGLELRSPARSVDIFTFQIGDGISDEDDRDLGQFALHIQCPFRIRRNEKVLAGSDDVFVARDENTEDFDWTNPDSSLYDASADHIFDREKRNFIISGFSIGESGAFSMYSETGWFLETFPCRVGKVEHWRILEFGVAHYVLQRRELFTHTWKAED